MQDEAFGTNTDDQPSRSSVFVGLVLVAMEKGLPHGGGWKRDEEVSTMGALVFHSSDDQGFLLKGASFRTTEMVRALVEIIMLVARLLLQGKPVAVEVANGQSVRGTGLDTVKDPYSGANDDFSRSILNMDLNNPQLDQVHFTIRAARLPGNQQQGATDWGQAFQRRVQAENPGLDSRLVVKVVPQSEYDGAAISLYVPFDRTGLEGREIETRRVVLVPMGGTLDWMKYTDHNTLEAYKA